MRNQDVLLTAFWLETEGIRALAEDNLQVTGKEVRLGFCTLRAFVMASGVSRLGAVGSAAFFRFTHHPSILYQYSSSLYQ